MGASEARTPIGHAARIRAAFVIGVAAAIASSGCAGVSPTLDRWLGREPATAAGVFYSAVDGLTVYAGPARSSGVVGRLALHERVVRSKLEGGYAYVRAGQSGLEGWVDNSKLLWRLPTAGAPPAAAAEEPAATGGEGEAGPAEGEAAEAAPAASEPPAPATPPAGEPAEPPAGPAKPKPSVFDPF
jgi:hypothetical protein